MPLHFRRTPIWIVLNLIGMATYLRLGLDFWTIPGDKGLPGGPGNAFYWFFLMLPVLLAYLVINLISLSAIIERVRQTGRLNALYIWLAIAVLWIVTFRYDRLRCFRVICPDTGCWALFRLSVEERCMSAMDRSRTSVTVRETFRLSNMLSCRDGLLSAVDTMAWMDAARPAMAIGSSSTAERITQPWQRLRGCLPRRSMSTTAGIWKWSARLPFARR